MANILAIGAHPDDIEIGCLGFLLKAKQLGCHTEAVILTRGNAGFEGDPVLRTEEGNKAAETAGIKLTWGDFSDSKLTFAPPGEIETFLATIIAELKPTIILAPWKNDNHFDHIAVYHAVKKAVFLACRKEYTKTPWEPKQLMYYVLGYRNTVSPSVLLDITDVAHLKKNALAEHKSQDQVIAKYDGLYANYQITNLGKLSEAFIVEEPLRISNIQNLI